jgi:acyl-CoA dehydrogenase
LWSTNAHLSDFMIALFRTRPADEKDRHAGLSQFLVDLRASGLAVRPIRDVTGGAHFNELVFDDVFLPDDMLVGAEGEGWRQATAELAFERSGPERYLSSFPLLPPAIDALRTRDDAAAAIGRLVAHASVLRQMSLAVAGMLDRGESPGPQAALVKDLGADLEQGIPEQVRMLLDPPPYADEQDEVGRLLAYLTQAAPSFSLRGGTREILRGIVAREIGLR